VGDEAMPVRGSPGMSGGGEAARWRRRVAQLELDVRGSGV
jgi:hypothetical protein